MAPRTSKGSSSHFLSKSSQRVTTLLDPTQTHANGNNATQKRLKPLLSVSFAPAASFPVSRPPAFNLDASPLATSASAPSSSAKGKSKEKPRAEVISLLDNSDGSDEEEGLVRVDNSLWVDQYEPRSEAELAVHKRKVEDVRGWLQEALNGFQSGTLRKYRRILVLTGPAGSAKTTTIRVLAKEIGFEISEWRSSVEESYNVDDYDRESNNTKFETFLARAGSCNTLFAGPSALSTTAHFSSSDGSARPPKKIVLLEDLPNILHQPTQESFHAALTAYCAEPESAPLVIILSDVPVRGDVKDERVTVGGSRGYYSGEQTIDIRTALPQNLINSPYVTQILFNPIAPTLMLRALQELLSRHASESNTSQFRRPTKEDLNVIVEASNGDIRSAIMSLQFCSIHDDISSANVKKHTSKRKRKDTRAWANTTALMEPVTRREHALALFHLMGKVLYNKRKGDPSNASASAKERLREQEEDAKMNNPEPLPAWLAHHERRASRINVDSLYASSPIDSSLYALYLHQNYAQFCNEMEECEALCDWLSWVDSNGGEQWYQANPYRFHLLTLGTLHSLPSPVARRSQKIFKPTFFDVIKKTRHAEDAVHDVWLWLQGDTKSARWAQAEIALELGAVLKAGKTEKSETRVPPSHTAFSIMSHANSYTGALDVLDPGVLAGDDEEHGQSFAPSERTVQFFSRTGSIKPGGGSWLENDDIEDFDT